MLKREGAFDLLLQDLETPELAEVLSDQLGIDLRGKPRMITVRKWSALKDGRIHNDGEAKIATSLLYLNKDWDAAKGGAIRVLRDEHNFENMAAEVAPVFGNFFAFRRTENSWHGHKPFDGKRHVIQITWLRSEADLARKEKRGWLSFQLKKLFGSSY